MARARVTTARILSPWPNRRSKGLADALVPGLPIERFGRTWRLEVDRDVVDSLRRIETSSSERLPAFVRGRLGFDKTTGSAPAWNEHTEQFEIRPQHDGDVVPFSIRLADLTVAYQRTAKIKRQSFIGALQRLLREGSQTDDWRVIDTRAELAWEEFTSQVATVTEVRIKVRPTNPGWDGQELFEPYIEQLGGREATIVVKGDGLDLSSTPVQQARIHAIENHYGELDVKGQTGSGFPIAFDSEEPVPLVDEEVVVPRGTKVPHGALEQVIRDGDEIGADAAAPDGEMG